MNEYTNFLKTKIFNIEKQKSFEIMFNMFEDIVKYSEKSLILERSFIYTGKSIFSALLENNCDVIDYKPLKSLTKKGFQDNWISNSKFEFKMAKSQIIENKTDLEIKNLKSDAKILVVPNVLHHCRDFQSTLEIIFDKCKYINKVFIYDSYLRENHQNPDDYCRYTVSAIDYLLGKFKFKRFYKNEYGNIFDAILYLFDQADVNLKKYPELKEIAKKTNDLRLKLLPIRNVLKYRKLGRPHASMETSYSLGYKLNA